VSWRRFFERDRRDADAARELQSYIELETADNIARGLRPDDARAAASRKLGNVTRIREEIYVMNSMPFDALWQDVRYAVAQDAHRPGPRGSPRSDIAMTPWPPPLGHANAHRSRNRNEPYTNRTHKVVQ
jgi:hypothetical protein